MIFLATSYYRICGWAAVAAWLIPGPLAGSAGPHSDPADPGSSAMIQQARSGIRKLKQIDDAGTHLHWILIRDDARPGGPGRLVQASQVAESAAQRSTSEMLTGSLARGEKLASVADSPGLKVNAVVIRAGDRLLVTEHSPTVEAQIEAVALEPATAGTALRVRMKSGGVVWAVALGAGSARLAPAGEGWQ